MREERLLDPISFQRVTMLVLIDHKFSGDLDFQPHPHLLEKMNASDRVRVVPNFFHTNEFLP